MKTWPIPSRSCAGRAESGSPGSGPMSSVLAGIRPEVGAVLRADGAVAGAGGRGHLRTVSLRGVGAADGCGRRGRACFSRRCWRRSSIRGSVDLPGFARRHGKRRLAQAGLEPTGSTLCPGVPRCPLPEGADAVSLVRVLYDHDDATVPICWRRCHAALPAGGRLIVSEPMSAAAGPDRRRRRVFRLLYHGDGHRARAHAGDDRGALPRGGIRTDPRSRARAGPL